MHPGGAGEKLNVLGRDSRVIMLGVSTVGAHFSAKYP